jgi:hypothetical protein
LCDVFAKSWKKIEHQIIIFIFNCFDMLILKYFLKNYFNIFLNKKTFKINVYYSHGQARRIDAEQKCLIDVRPVSVKKCGMLETSSVCFKDIGGDNPLEWAKS